MLYTRPNESSREFRLKHSKYIQFARRVFEVRTEPEQWDQHNGKRVMTFDEFSATFKDPKLVRSLRNIGDATDTNDAPVSDEDIR
jgi:hypothetical protein